DELTEGRHPNASELTDGRIEVVRAELNRRLNLDGTLVRAFPVGVPNDERGQGGSVRIRLHTVVSALAGGESDPGEPAPSAVAIALESDGGNTARVGPGVGRVKFPNGGTMNIVQDAADPQPRLDVLTQDALTVFGGRITEPVTFRTETNYGAYLDRHELVVLDGRDPEGSRPLAIVAGAGAPPSIIRWDGTTQRDHTFAEHDQLHYLLRVWNADGRMDVTRARTLTLTRTEVHGVDFNQIAEKITGQDNTERRSIPVNGTRVRMEGTMPPGSRLALDGREVAADAGGRFIAEEILPDGLHEKRLVVVDGAKLAADMEAGRMPVAGGGGPASGGSGVMGVPLAIEVDGDDSFFVGIADLTVGQNDLSGPGAFLVNDPRFDNDVFTQGRLAFYLRERLGGGRGQFTAHLDTREEELENIFKNLDNKDPRRLFRRLDADRYHHNYGDGSTVTPDVDTQGRFYGRLDWDQSRLMWGNYATGLTGTEFAEFNRTLYGGLLNYRSTAATDDAESRVQATAFASEAETAFSHEEFLGTGGSLYYLRYRDVVQGSEKIFVEIRDRDSDRVTDRRTLLRGRDYEFDDLQGRVILSRPLLQIADQISPSIIKDEPLDGNRARLIVDYEYLPVQTADADWLYGGRAKAWVVDELAVGGTYVDESRAGQDYQMVAGDVTIRGGAGTYIRGEYAETEATQASTALFSDDGGFTFRAMDATPLTVDRTGEAMSAEARLDLADFTSADVELTGWYKDRDAGFSTARLGTGQEVTSYGGELRWHTRVFSVSGRWASA
ncbi:MAG: hypothetical protein HKN12_09215, partial [Gemmatimonadetes bacterium]|nr:hypothetical protein [Gemmatimonadota bacterium]